MLPYFGRHSAQTAEEEQATAVAASAEKAVTEKELRVEEPLLLPSLL